MKFLITTLSLILFFSCRDNDKATDKDKTKQVPRQLSVIEENMINGMKKEIVYLDTSSMPNAKEIVQRLRDMIYDIENRPAAIRTTEREIAYIKNIMSFKPHDTTDADYLQFRNTLVRMLDSLESLPE